VGTTNTLQSHSLAFTIGNWANLYSITEPSTHSGCTVPQLNLSATATNRLSGLGYDAAGNTTSDGVYTYSYNAENQQTSRVARVAQTSFFDVCGA
jgi:hypothetical protein